MGQLPKDLQDLGAKSVEIPDDLKSLGAKEVTEVPQEEIQIKNTGFQFTAPPEQPKPSFLQRVVGKYNELMPGSKPGEQPVNSIGMETHIPYVEDAFNWLADRTPPIPGPAGSGSLGLEPAVLRLLGSIFANPMPVPGKSPAQLPIKPPPRLLGPAPAETEQFLNARQPNVFSGGPTGASGQVAPANMPPDILARIAGMGEGNPATSGLGSVMDTDWLKELRRQAALKYTAAEQYPGTRLTVPDQPVLGDMGIPGETKGGYNPSAGYNFDALPNRLRPRAVQGSMRATAGNMLPPEPEVGSNIEFTSGGPEVTQDITPPRPEFNIPSPQSGEYQLPSARKFNVFDPTKPGEMPPAEVIPTKAGKMGQAPRTQFGFTKPGLKPEEAEQALASEKLKAAMSPDEIASGMGTRVWNIPRSIKASWDMSAPFRQGKGLILNKAWWTSWDDMVKAWGSENAYQAIQNSIETDKDFALAMRGKLSITDLGKAVSGREEAFASDLAEKLPLGRRSNRAYNAFNNKARFDTFKSMVADYDAAGIDIRNNDVLLQKVANQINSASGRGSLKFSGTLFGKEFGVDLTKNTDLLTNVAFAPKLISSRLKIMMSPFTYANADKIQRIQAIKTLAGLTGASITELALMKAAGAKLGVDPTSSDFWKGKFGNVRMDPNAGFEPYFTLMAREITGHYTSSSTGIGYDLGKKFGLSDRLSSIGEFSLNKTNPNINFALNLARAMTGNLMKPSSIEFGNKHRPFNMTTLNPFENEAVKLVTPMILDDMYDVYKENPKLLPLTVPYGFFGGGVQAYK
jgi:hypothetical protein